VRLRVDQSRSSSMKRSASRESTKVGSRSSRGTCEGSREGRARAEGGRGGRCNYKLVKTTKASGLSGGSDQREQSEKRRECHVSARRVGVVGE